MLQLTVSRLSGEWDASTSHNPIGLQGMLQEWLYLCYLYFVPVINKHPDRWLIKSSKQCHVHFYTVILDKPWVQLFIYFYAPLGYCLRSSSLVLYHEECRGFTLCLPDMPVILRCADPAWTYMEVSTESGGCCCCIFLSVDGFHRPIVRMKLKQYHINSIGNIWTDVHTRPSNYVFIFGTACEDYKFNCSEPLKLKQLNYFGLIINMYMIMNKLPITRNSKIPLRNASTFWASALSYYGALSSSTYAVDAPRVMQPKHRH
jgi:hypothetical protein